MTQYSYNELWKALTKASIAHDGIAINGDKDMWLYIELVQLQTILDYLPEKPTVVQEMDKNRSDAWLKVIEHPLFEEARWSTSTVEAILEKLDELHRRPLPTEYGSIIKNVKVKQPYTNMWEYDYMQLTNIGWFGVDKDNGVLQEAKPKHITSWEPCSE